MVIHLLVNLVAMELVQTMVSRNLVAMELVQTMVSRNHICCYSQTLKAISVKAIHSFPEGAKQ